MFRRYKKAVFLLAMLMCILSVNAQTDSLVVDSIVHRLKEILVDYNDKVIFMDTTVYVYYYIPDADNINLQIAAENGDCNTIVKLYVAGADVNNFVGGTATPLLYSVSADKKEATEILLLLGAQTNIPDRYGNTALISAIRSGNLDMAELLIRYGASLTDTDKARSSPLHHSAALGNFYITDMLLYYDSPTDLYDNEGNTPLMLATNFGYFDIADILLRAGADPNTPDKKGFTPLMVAAQNGDTLMIRLLMEAGANLYSVNNEGINALGCAIIGGKPDAVKFLIDNGKRWNSFTGMYTDPVTLAKSYGRKEIVSILTDRKIKSRHHFSMNELSFSAGGLFTEHYQMINGSVTLADPVLKAGIIAGAAYNPFNQRMLIAGDDDIIYQYRVNSSVIYAGLFKRFILNIPNKENRLSIITSLSAGYQFYSLYEGTNEKPENRFCLKPSVELRYSWRRVAVSPGVTYINTPFEKISSVWLSINLSYFFTNTASSITSKRIRLYNYE